MIITFSGTSGSGKSTIISYITKSQLFAGRKIIVREEDSFVTISVAKRIFGEHIFSRYKDEKYFKKKYNDVFYKIFVTFCYILYPAAVYIEFFKDYLIYQVISKNTVFIIDKFIYDHAVHFRNILGIDNIFVDWMYSHFPKPYLSFLIDIDLKRAAVTRNKNNIKGKITAHKSFHKNLLNQYHKIAKKNKLIVIHNNGPFKDAVSQVTTYIKNKEKLLSAHTIAICGLDGAGKTTVSNMLEKYATSLNVKCKVVHFVHNNLLYRLLLSVGYYKTNESQIQIYKRSREYSARERIKKTSFTRAFLRFFDSYVQYLFYMLFNRNKLIIFDRYFYDYLVSFEYLNIKWRSFFNIFIPSVKYTFLFESSPMSLYKRKPERVKDFFIECHAIYMKVAAERKMKIIHTGKKRPVQVFQELMQSLH